MSLLDAAGDPGEVLPAFRSLPGTTGAAAAAYIDRVGHRPVKGEDPGEPSVIELPELIVAAIRSGLESAESAPAGDLVAQRSAEVRDAVPTGHRDGFDAGRPQAHPVGPAPLETVLLWVKLVASMGPDELADFEERTFRQWDRASLGDLRRAIDRRRKALKA